LQNKHTNLQYNVQERTNTSVLLTERVFSPTLKIPFGTIFFIHLHIPMLLLRCVTIYHKTLAT